MSTLWKDIQYKLLKSGNKLSLLIGINVIVYLGINAVAVIEQLKPLPFKVELQIEKSIGKVALP